jgi:LysM repeat protein
MVTYIVQPGDTLTLIAQRFGSTVAVNRNSTNNISDPNLIFVGQVLQIPVAGAPPTPARRLLHLLLLRLLRHQRLPLQCLPASGSTLCSRQILWHELAGRFGTTVQVLVTVNRIFRSEPHIRGTGLVCSCTADYSCACTTRSSCNAGASDARYRASCTPGASGAPYAACPGHRGKSGVCSPGRTKAYFHGE